MDFTTFLTLHKVNKGLNALASAATSGNVVLVKAQIVSLCWRLGFSRRDQDEKLQPSLCVLAQQLNAWPKWMCVRTMWPRVRAEPCRPHPPPATPLLLPRPLLAAWAWQSWGAAAQGCGVSEPGPGGAGAGQAQWLHYFFFLQIVLGSQDCRGGLVVVKCCLDIHVQYSLIYLSFVCVDLHHCFYWF